MANKHAAGCTCCQAGCIECDTFVTNVSVTLGSRTLSWAVNKNLSEINGCCLNFSASYTTSHNVLDYYLADAWDGTQGDCWKAFQGSPCCGSTGGGGPGPGGGPVPLDICIPCVSYAGNTVCEDTYLIETYKIKDLNINVRLNVTEQYSLSICFKTKEDGTVDISFAAFTSLGYQSCSTWSYDSIVYKNTNCPRTEDCATFVPTSSICNGKCDDQDCLTTAYINCASDVPTWSEFETVNYCASPCSFFFESKCSPCFEYDCLCGNGQNNYTPLNPPLASQFVPNVCYCFNKAHSAGWDYADPTPAFNRECDEICGSYALPKNDTLAEQVSGCDPDDICVCNYPPSSYPSAFTIQSPGSCWFPDAAGSPSPLPVDWCQEYHEDCCEDTSVAPSTISIDLPDEPADAVTVVISCS